MIRAAAIFGGDDSAIAKLSKFADFYAVPHIILTSMAYFSVRIYTSLAIGIITNIVIQFWADHGVKLARTSKHC